MANIKISQLPAKGANLAAEDLLEVSEFTGTGYVSKSITGQEIIDAASGGGGGGVTPTHILFPPKSGFYYGAILDTPMQVTTLGAGDMNLTAFTPANTLTSDQMIIQITTASVGGFAKAVIYGSLDGNPYDKLYESSEVSTDTTGTKIVLDGAFTFEANTTYFVTIVGSATIGYRAIDTGSAAGAPILAYSNSTQTYQTYRYATNDYYNLPTILATPTTSNLSGTRPPYLIFRAA